MTEYVQTSKTRAPSGPMSLPDQSSQTDCQGGGSEFELRIPILVNLFKVGLPTSTHSVGTWQATRAPHVIAFTCGDRVGFGSMYLTQPRPVFDWYAPTNWLVA